MRKLTFAVLAGALALSACGKKQEEQPEVEATNNLVAPPDETVIDANNVAEPAPVEVHNSAAPLAPPEISDNEQMLEDAAASGLTTRLRRGADGEPAADHGGTEPVQNADMPES